MFALLFGSQSAERVLLYLQRYGEGHAAGIARTSGLAVNLVQRQLRKFEDAGILVSFSKGKTRLFCWNPRYSFLPELRALLERAFDFMPEEELAKYYLQRTRPRRAGKA